MNSGSRSIRFEEFGEYFAGFLQLWILRGSVVDLGSDGGEVAGAGRDVDALEPELAHDAVEVFVARAGERTETGVAVVQELYNRAFARLDRVAVKRQEFAHCWAEYIAVHPWGIDVRNVDSCTLEILAVMREPAPVELVLIFSEWLAALRASLDNAIYALAASATGQNPPPQAGRIQFPICSTPDDFRGQAKRLTMLPAHIIEALEKEQPYQSPWGPESNLTWWVNELARKDRHRELHVGLGRVDEHRVRVAPPSGVTIEFDTTVEPYSHIARELVVARFTASRPLRPEEITADLRGVVIAPEIEAWADFRLNGRRQSLEDRMVYTEIFTRNHLENMTLMGGCIPPGGFRTFDPADPEDVA